MTGESFDFSSQGYMSGRADEMEPHQQPHSHAAPPQASLALCKWRDGHSTSGAICLNVIPDFWFCEIYTHTLIAAIYMHTLEAASHASPPNLRIFDINERIADKETRPTF